MVFFQECCQKIRLQTSELRCLKDNATIKMDLNVETSDYFILGAVALVHTHTHAFHLYVQ